MWWLLFKQKINVLYLCRDLSHLVSSALRRFPFAPVPEYTKFNRLHFKRCNTSLQEKSSCRLHPKCEYNYFHAMIHVLDLASAQELHYGGSSHTNMLRCSCLRCNGYCGRLCTVSSQDSRSPGVTAFFSHSGVYLGTSQIYD